MSETKDNGLQGLLDKTRDELHWTIDDFYIEIFPGSIRNPKGDGFVSSSEAPIKFLFKHRTQGKLVVSTLAFASVVAKLEKEFPQAWKESKKLAKKAYSDYQEKRKAESDLVKEL